MGLRCREGVVELLMVLNYHFAVVVVDLTIFRLVDELNFLVVDELLMLLVVQLVVELLVRWYRKKKKGLLIHWIEKGLICINWNSILRRCSYLWWNNIGWIIGHGVRVIIIGVLI